MSRRTAARPDGDLHEKRALIALSLVPGVGAGRVRQLVTRLGSAQRVLAASVDALARVPGIGPQTATAIAKCEAGAAVDDQIRRAVRTRSKMVLSEDDRYPYLLKNIYDPPAFLWVRGHLPVTDGPELAISIVGTRRPTAYGKRIAHELARELAAIGFTIVSGLAYGIDACAHRGALEAGGRTIGVLGSGVDRIYPTQHSRLAHRILEQGALVSEFSMGASPEAGNFPRRNRIVSGLSLGSLIVEAFDEGGALITARLALEQNREVFAVPGPVTSKASSGAHRLIQDGYAKLVQGVDDILDELDVNLPSNRIRNETTIDLTQLAPEEQALCRAMDTEARHIDQICSESGLDPSTALAHLLSLEFKGLVRQLAGMQFFLSRPILPIQQLPPG